MAYQSQDIIRRSAIDGFAPASQARSHQEEVAKLIDVTTCTGCKARQMVCSEWNDVHDKVGSSVGVYDSPVDLTAKSWTVVHFLEVEQDDKLEWLTHKDGRIYYADPGCLKACPTGDTIIQYTNGIVDSQSEQRIGCGYYIAGYPFNVPRLNPEDNHVYKYTLCVDRVVVGQGPACVKTYPTGIIYFDTKESMKTLVDKRMAELETRGYENAGLYDPAGVDDTRMIYVLHHAGKPSPYHGLPESLEISAAIRFWKGIWESLIAVGFAATFAASIFYYTGINPNCAEGRGNNLHEKDGEARKRNDMTPSCATRCWNVSATGSPPSVSFWRR